MTGSGDRKAEVQKKMDAFYQKFGRNCEAARLAAGLSKSALAELTGLTRQTVIGVENAKQGATVFTALLLAEALGVDLNFLVGQPTPVDLEKARRYDRDRFLLEVKAARDRLDGIVNTLETH